MHVGAAAGTTGSPPQCKEGSRGLALNSEEAFIRARRTDKERCMEG